MFVFISNFFHLWVHHGYTTNLVFSFWSFLAMQKSAPRRLTLAVNACLWTYIAAHSAVIQADGQVGDPKQQGGKLGGSTIRPFFFRFSTTSGVFGCFKRELVRGFEWLDVFWGDWNWWNLRLERWVFFPWRNLSKTSSNLGTIHPNRTGGPILMERLVQMWLIKHHLVDRWSNFYVSICDSDVTTNR